MVLNYTPPTYASVHSELLFVAYDAAKIADPATYPDYKYICDIYISGSFVSRLKAVPNPDNDRGVFNIGPIVRAYLNELLLSPGSGIYAQNFADGEFFVDVQVKIGEEYGFDTYSNILVDTLRYFFNHYDKEQTTLGDYLDLPATNRPRTIYVQRDQEKVFVPFLPLATSYDIEIHLFDGGDSDVADDGETKSCDSLALQQLNLAPAAITATFPGLGFDDQITRYTVKLNDEVFNLVFICEPIYDVYPVHFFNQLGGFDTILFSKVSRKSYEMERKTYTQLPYRINSSGVASYENAAGIKHEQKTTFATAVNEFMTLTTDILTDAEHTWLKELMFSPLVYIEVDSKLYPVTIKSNSYQEKQSGVDKLQPVQIEIELGRFNSQFR